jgi:hypothetical protein
MDINERELLFNQKYLHQQKTVEYLYWVNTILVYIYYLCALVIIYYLFTKYDFSNYSKITFLILLGLYPFIAYFLQEKIQNGGHYIGSMFSILGLFLYGAVEEWFIQLLSLPYYYLYILAIIYGISIKDGFHIYNQIIFFLFLILYPFIGDYIHTIIF